MIHNTAIIDPSAVIADNVSIGAYSIIGADVEIGSGCDIKSHVVINGPTKIGEDNKIFQFSSIGEEPQDKKYANEPTTLEIGNNNLIRENVTINRGTVQGGGLTKIGDNNWIMTYVHIAHDCIIGSDNILANNASLAGHVIVDDFVILGGFTLVSQFKHIGSHAFSAMASVISRHIPPYVLVSGHMAKPIGMNVEGLRRRGFSDVQIKNVRQAYKLIYRKSLRVEEAELKLLEITQEDHELDCLITFLQEQEGGIIR
ncbi:MAG: acyl-ACP--UDP-N-acetylglucosamine O-acyltransferase [Piscirickettsiaceae bacterium]|nr:acyl-ACP--UDP-N-acetylglucosamine O-acyltransferase [Piscirickettsiaceae bacterium]